MFLPDQDVVVNVLTSVSTTMAHITEDDNAKEFAPVVDENESVKDNVVMLSRDNVVEFIEREFVKINAFTERNATKNNLQFVEGDVPKLKTIKYAILNAPSNILMSMVKYGDDANAQQCAIKHTE